MREKKMIRKRKVMERVGITERHFFRVIDKIKGRYPNGEMMRKDALGWLIHPSMLIWFVPSTIPRETDKKIKWINNTVWNAIGNIRLSRMTEKESVEVIDWLKKEIKSVVGDSFRIAYSIESNPKDEENKHIHFLIQCPDITNEEIRGIERRLIALGINTKIERYNDSFGDKGVKYTLKENKTIGLERVYVRTKKRPTTKVKR